MLKPSVTAAPNKIQLTSLLLAFRVAIENGRQDTEVVIGHLASATAAAGIMSERQNFLVCDALEPNELPGSYDNLRLQYAREGHVEMKPTTYNLILPDCGKLGMLCTASEADSKANNSQTSQPKL